MYASSVIGSIERIESVLEQLHSLSTYDRDTPFRSLVSAAFATTEEVGSLLEVLIPVVSVDGFTTDSGDDPVASLLSARIDEGIETELDPAAIEAAREADRIEVVDGTVIVPLGRRMPGVRNWWLLTGLLADWLGDLVDGYERVKRRAESGASATTVGAIASVVAMLSDLRSTLSRCRSLGRYLVTSTDHGTGRLLHTVERFARVINA